jgi:hypothetical protein
VSSENIAKEEFLNVYRYKNEMLLTAYYNDKNPNLGYLLKYFINKE